MFHENWKWQHCETVVSLCKHQHPLLVAQWPSPLKLTAVDSLMNLVAASPFWDPCDQFEVFSLFLKKHLKLPTKKPPQKNNLLLEFSCHYPSQNFVTTSYTSLFFAVFSSFGLLLFFSRISLSLFAKKGYSSCYKLLKDNPTWWNLFRHHPSLIISTLQQSLPSFTCFPGFLIFKSCEDVTVHQELLYVHRICFWYLSSQEITVYIISFIL